VTLDPELSARAAALRVEIERASYEYHVLDRPTISDREYDQLYRELLTLEEQYPTLRTADSPTQRVGAEPATQLAKHTHLVPMLSLGNAFDEGELEDWEKRIVRLGGDSVRASGYTAELKIDGAAVSLTYRDGVLEIGTTRGNGRVALRTILSMEDDAVSTSDSFNTQAALLNKINGRKTIPKGFVLHTAGADITTAKMGLWQRVLDTLIDPNLIALMLSLGVLGIVIELWHPGLIFPATFGVLCLAIAFYGLDVLPISWAGVILLIAAFAFWIAEAFVGFSHGALTLAGAVCFVFGSLLLFKPAGSGYQVSLWTALAIAAAFCAVFALVLVKLVQIRTRPPAVGTNTLVGVRGQVRSDGLVSIRGELWQARIEDDERLEAGDEVEVAGVEGLELVVRPAREPAAV